MADIHGYAPLWGSWHIESLIGEGSFGKVYKVRKEEFGKTYFSAVKIISIPQSEGDVRRIRGEGLDEDSVRSYFQALVTDISREIDLMSQFRGNSNVVSYEDHQIIERSGAFGWDILIRMELLQSLADHAMAKPLDEKEAAKLGIHICRALELCALHDTIHRDIKPDNIFISEFGEYKLGDFGVARQIERTMSGLSKKGTYNYMAPEVFRGGRYGANADIYSLGIVLYQMLNRGRTPFLPDYPKSILPADKDAALQRRMGGEAVPPLAGVDPALSEIILRACAYDRHARFATATEMREAMEAYTGGSYQPLVSPLPQRPAPAPVLDDIEVTVVAFDVLPHDPTEITVGAFKNIPVPKPPVMQAKKKKSHKGLVIGLICLAVLIMGTVGGLTWYQGTQGSLEEYYSNAEELSLSGSYEQCIAYVDEVEPRLLRLPAIEQNQRIIGNIYYMQANSLFMLEEYQRALSVYNFVVTNYVSDNPEIIRDYAIAYARTGNIDRAESYLKSMVDINADPPSIALLKGEIAFAKGQYTEAVQHFEELLNLPAASDYMRLRAVLICDKVYRQLNKLTENISMLRNALNTLPGQYETILTERLADVLAKNDENAEALALYVQLCDDGDRRFSTLQNIGLLYQKMKQYEKAQAAYEDLRKEFTSRHEPFMRMALCEISYQNTLVNAKRNYANAQQHYEQAKAIYDIRPSSSGDDPDMNRLGDLMGELRRGGWFDPDHVITEIVTVTVPVR